MDTTQGASAPRNPFTFTSPNEEFKVIFPSGCSKLVARSNEPDLFGGETWDDIIQVQYVTCDRFGEKGEGCSVSSTLNWHSREGEPADSGQVIAQVEKALQQFGVQVLRQKSVRKEFGNSTVIEGVDVHAKNPELPGEVWIRGLLVDADIHIMIAWNEDGGLWDDPEYHAFFNSFQPFLD